MIKELHVVHNCVSSYYMYVQLCNSMSHRATLVSGLYMFLLIHIYRSNI